MGNDTCKALITQEELHRLFDYDPETGVLTRRLTTSANAVEGSRAGCVNGAGYRMVHLLGAQRLEHRLIWVYVYGSIPPALQIDHINRTRDDNRLCNLRLATKAMNHANSVVARSNNTSGIKGVSWHKQRGKWRANIGLNGRFLHLGLFDTAEAAQLAYAAAADKMFGEFANYQGAA